MRNLSLRGLVCAAALCCGAVCASAQKTVTDYTFAPHEGDFIAHDFKFSDGQTLPEVRLHYSTLGTPKRVTSPCGPPAASPT